MTTFETRTPGGRRGICFLPSRKAVAQRDAKHLEMTRKRRRAVFYFSASNSNSIALPRTI